MRITRTIEFDAGHRVPSHDGKCRSPHGHRYKVEAVLDGAVIVDATRPDDGMVVDFGMLKHVLDERVHDRLDHAFIIGYGDSEMQAAISVDRSWKHYIMAGPPTAENLASQIAEWLASYFGAQLVEVTVWETPNCKATWTK